MTNEKEIKHWARLLLTYDSIYPVLTWYERAAIHFYIQGKSDEIIMNEKVMSYIDRLYNLQWVDPKIRYRNSADLYCSGDGDYGLSLEDYKSKYPPVL